MKTSHFLPYSMTEKLAIGSEFEKVENRRHRPFQSTNTITYRKVPAWDLKFVTVFLSQSNYENFACYLRLEHWFWHGHRTCPARPYGSPNSIFLSTDLITSQKSNPILKIFLQPWSGIYFKFLGSIVTVADQNTVICVSVVILNVQNHRRN